MDADDIPAARPKRHDGFAPAPIYDEMTHHNRAAWLRASQLWERVSDAYGLPSSLGFADGTTDTVQPRQSARRRQELQEAGWHTEFVVTLCGAVALFVRTNADLTSCETEVADLAQEWHGEFYGRGMNNAL